jgi:hypothetical protein
VQIILLLPRGGHWASIVWGGGGVCGAGNGVGVGLAARDHNWVVVCHTPADQYVV